MRKNVFGLLAAVLLLATASIGAAQPAKGFKIGALVPGNAWYDIIDGLKSGLKPLGLEEGKQFVLAVPDTVDARQLPLKTDTEYLAVSWMLNGGSAHWRLRGERNSSQLRTNGAVANPDWTGRDSPGFDATTAPPYRGRQRRAVRSDLGEL